jgi:hypothetical protein
MLLTPLKCDGRAEKAFIKWLLDMFPTLYSRWQKCTVAQRGQFEGYVAYMIVLFRISQKYSDFGNRFLPL